MEPRHSGLGIASFIASILCAVCLFVLFVIAGVLEASTPGGLDEESLAAMVVGLLLFAFLFGSLVAFALGLAGLFQQNRRTTFAILGTVFSAMTILGTIGLIVIGMAMG
ncbi:hypothetical protein BH23PLA1_BH23PLA1_31980 [soil metagenome]